MAEKWRDYQQEVAEFFRSLGLNVSIEERIKGARGIHAIDVWVTFKRLGFDIKWVVECKFWQSAVPKAAVLTLQQIVQDVGADRAFLLSEAGFQSGAIKVTRNTNVTLTNLEELRENAQEEILDSTLVTANKMIATMESILNPFIMDEEGRPFPQPGIDVDEILSASGALLFLRLAMQEAFARKFPIRFPSVRNYASVLNPNLQTFIQNITIEVEELSQKVNRIKLKAEEIHQQAIDSCRQLVTAVEQLVADAEVALYSLPEGDPRFEKARLQSLSTMKAVGWASEKVKSLATREIRSELHQIMRLLIDTVYLHFTKPTIPLAEWDKTKQSVAERVENIKKIIIKESINQ